MSGDIKPLLKNGSPNPAWIQQHLEKRPGTLEKYAMNALYNAVREMEEPPLETTSGKPNPVWVTWYHAVKFISKNIALNICKNKINGTHVESKRSSEWLDGPTNNKKWGLQ